MGTKIFWYVFVCMSGCVYQSLSGFLYSENRRYTISRAKNLLNSPGPHHRIPQTHSQTRRHNHYTTANKQFYLPSPRHSFLHCSIKGKRLFPLFPGKWILYQLCVCKSDLRFPESRGYYSYLLHCICKSSTI